MDGEFKSLRNNLSSADEGIAKEAANTYKPHEPERCFFPKIKGPVFKSQKAKCIHNLAEISKEQQALEEYVKEEADPHVSASGTYTDKLEKIEELIDELDDIGCLSPHTIKNMRKCYSRMKYEYEEYQRTNNTRNLSRGNLSGDILNMWAVTRGANEAATSESKVPYTLTKSSP